MAQENDVYNDNDDLDVIVHILRCTYSSLDTFTLDTNCYEVSSSVTVRVRVRVRVRGNPHIVSIRTGYLYRHITD